MAAKARPARAHRRRGEAVVRKARQEAADRDLAFEPGQAHADALVDAGAEGDVSGPKPGFFDFVGTAKYEAWGKLKGTRSEDAMQKYVDLVKKLGG